MSFLLLTKRDFHLRLHPFPVREWVEMSDASSDKALNRLVERGGMPDTSG